MSARLRYLFTWPLANIARSPWTSTVTFVAVFVATFLATSLLGFVEGYQQRVEEDVDRLGYDLLITAKGCPYEAATLMLRGGVGLKYMPSGVVDRLKKEEAVTGLFPMLIHPIKVPGADQGITLLKGVAPGWYQSLNLQMREGDWYSESQETLTGEGIILGYEAAELEKRHVGDPYLLYDGKTESFVETKVRGVLERTGTQVDGTVLLPLNRVQSRYDLPGKLTGVGVRVRSDSPTALEELRDTYNLEPELQVVSLSKVEETLRNAMANMHDVIGLLAAILALMAAGILLNTTLLRTLSEQKRFVTLRIIGIPAWFIGGAAVVENLLLTLFALGTGLAMALLTGGHTSTFLVSYLPYAPEGNLVSVSPSLLALMGIVGLGLALVATVIPMVKVLAFGSLQSLREDG